MSGRNDNYPAGIRKATPGDAAAICSIYNHYIANTIITFEEEPVKDKEMEERISEALQKFTWLVYEENGIVKGYAYASAWKSRCAYRYSAECTVYLALNEGGRGIGSLLYGRLIAEMKNMGMHSLLGGIALPNDQSVALHEKMGFEKVAQLREVGYKFGKWIDVGYWELIL